MSYNTEATRIYNERTPRKRTDETGVLREEALSDGESVDSEFEAEPWLVDVGKVMVERTAVVSLVGDAEVSGVVALSVGIGGRDVSSVPTVIVGNSELVLVLSLSAAGGIGILVVAESKGESKDPDMPSSLGNVSGFLRMRYERRILEERRIRFVVRCC